MRNAFSALVLTLIAISPAFGQKLQMEALKEKEPFFTLEDAMKNPNRVFRLNLSGKKLSEVPPEIFNFPNIQELDLMILELCFSSNKIIILM